MPYNEDPDIDLGKLRFSNTKLYGRTSELSRLTDICAGLTDESCPKLPEVVIISGQSGTGKTSIANQLREPVKMKGGYFISGKFNMSQRIEPYTALVAAFTELSDMIASDIRALFRLKVGIQNAVGTQGKVLTDVIPTLHRIINQEGDIADVSPLEAGNRFKYVLRNFVRAICNPSHPVVLFLDDLQWADPASLEVVQTLLIDSENSSFLVLGSYRSNEVGPDHRVTAMLRSIEEKQTKIHKIDVRNLSVPAVNDMLSDLLSESKHTVYSLANIIHCKTQGNAFYVMQFLMKLRDEGLLKYNLVQMRWQWDPDKINAMNVTQNVLDILMAKMEGLTPAVRSTLQVAACLGSCFKSSMLIAVIKNLNETDEEVERVKQFGTHEDDSEADLTKHLNTAINEDLIEKDDDVTYKFVHDQIRLASISSIPNDERDGFRHHIGSILLNHLSAEDRDKNLFVVVDLLNSRGMDIDAINKKVHLSNLNLKAAQKALSSFAFVPCTSYAKTGIALLEENPWKNHYALTLKLHTIAAESLYCSSNTVDTMIFVNMILSNAKSFDDKYHAYIIQIDTLASEAKNIEAIQKGLFVLGKMGIMFPRIGTILGTIATFNKTKKLLKRFSSSDLSLLPAMEDTKKIEIMRLLGLLTLCTYQCQSHQELMPWFVCKMVQCSIRYGLCEYSPAAFAGYGLILCMIGDLKGGYDYGQLSLLMSDRIGAYEMSGNAFFLVHGFIMCWTRPAPLSMKPLIQGYHEGMATGDVRSALLSIQIYTEIAFFSGYSLFLLEKDMKKFCHQMKDYNQGMVLRYELVLWQTVLNLMGQADNAVVLTGSAMDQDEMLEESKRQKNINMTAAIHVKRMTLCYYFGDYEMAGKLVMKTKVFRNTDKAGIFVVLHTFFNGLIALALAQKVKRRKWRRLSKKSIKKMKKWARNGNVNCGHMITLLEAEFFKFQCKKYEAESKYKSAITQAGKCGFIHDLALATERLGIFSLDNGDMIEASDHLSKAYKLWREWGAEAKAQNLYETYPKLVLISECESASDQGRKCTLMRGASELIVAGPLEKTP